jgi:hypothetical protein
LEAARRVEEVNQARSSYERQLAEYQQRLGEREFQVAQVKAELVVCQSQIDGFRQDGGVWEVWEEGGDCSVNYFLTDH